MKIGSRGPCRRRIKELAGLLPGTACRAALAGILFIVAPTLTSHAEFFVTSVIRDVPMKQGEAQYKDFYINAGTNNGLQKGIFLDALRKMAVFDNINSKLAGNTPVKIARLKVIHVDKNVSVARLVKFYEKETTPLAGFDNVMIGDVIEVSEKQ